MDIKKLKAIVKKSPEVDKPTFGTDPRDPWSAKANIAEDSLDETALLNRYLKSRGINPGFVSKDQKVAHSKTNQFKTWMMAHANDTVRESVTTQPSPTLKRMKSLNKSVRRHQEIRTDGIHKNLHSEEVDKKDTVTFDIPLLIRVLELSREDIKTDMDLHRVVERLINMRNKGMLTMDDYDAIAAIKEEVYSSVPLHYIKAALHEENGNEIEQRHAFHHGEMMKAMKSGDKEKQQHHLGLLHQAKLDWAAHQAKIVKPHDAISQDYKDQEAKRGIGRVRDHVEVEGQQLDEISKETATGYMHSAISDRNKIFDKISKATKKQGDDWSSRRHKNITKLLSKDDKRSKGIERALNRVKEETELDEAKEANYGGEYQHSVLNLKAKAEKKPVDMKSLAARMQASYAKDEKKPVKENMEPLAAVAQPCDCANTPDDIEPQNKGKKLIQMSKASRIKSIVKGKLKEDLYDTEKEDKSTASSKKTKFEKPGSDSITKEQPQAAAVLSGGKTLTGEPRDTIEIDPMMKMRKQTPDSQKSI